MKIYRLVYGETTLPESAIFYGGSREVKMPIVFAVYLADTGERKILIDAGCDTMPGFEMKNFTSPVPVLEQLGYKAEDITDVIITHAHHDHIDCVRHFPDSVIHIQNAEALAGRKYLTGNTQVELFEDSVMVAGCVRVRKIGGHSIGSCVVELERGEEIWVIAGDECYSYDCLNQQIPTGSSCCPEKSKQFVEQYARKPYRVLLCHDPDTVTGPIV